MKVAIYIGEDRLDLFSDEKIEVIQKLNDIEKLSNVFSDFTNSFNVPATQNNNRVFHHYYDVDVAGSFNASIRIDGLIEVDTLPFKIGQWQLESVQMKSYQPDSYKITFYGKITQLTDLFGEDTIDKLDYNKMGIKEWDSLSQFNFTRNGTNYVNALGASASFLGGNVIMPLISYSNRDWNYGSNDSNDISLSSSPIKDTELKPALRALRIIEGIETKYGITFSRDFFGRTFFEDLMLWLNSKQDKSSGKVELVWDNLTTYVRPTFPDPNPWWTMTIDSMNNVLNLTQTGTGYDPLRTFNYRADFISLRDPITQDALDGVQFTFTIEDSDTGAIYYTTTREATIPDGDTASSIFNINWNIPQDSTATSINLKAYLTAPVNFVFSAFNFRLQYIDPFNPSLAIYQTFLHDNGTNLDIVKMEYAMPSMRVIDFVQGLMKMFKLIIRPITSNSFYIDTLDSYYSNGTILDITKYTNQKEVLIERPVIYNKLSFRFQATENVLGKSFRLANDPIDKKIGYGDLKADYPLVADKQTLEVELPFENMMFERLTDLTTGSTASSPTNTNIAIGQSIKLDEDGVTLTKNDSKPILFFNNGAVGITGNPLKFRYSANTVQTLNQVFNIGNTNNITLGSVTDSVNWGAEIDPWHLVEVQASLYINYWRTWVETAYSTKQRKFKFEAYLPPRYTQEISLNDRIVIGQNRYKINDYKIDLVTGKTTLNLFNDIYML